MTTKGLIRDGSLVRAVDANPTNKLLSDRASESLHGAYLRGLAKSRSLRFNKGMYTHSTVLSQEVFYSIATMILKCTKIVEGIDIHTRSVYNLLHRG